MTHRNLPGIATIGVVHHAVSCFFTQFTRKLGWVCDTHIACIMTYVVGISHVYRVDDEP